MNDRLKYRYWQHTDWHDTNSPLEAVYCNAVDGCDPTTAISDFEFCTGLKDKYKNLIYEGDVVKDIAGEIYIIIWHNDFVGFVGRHLYQENRLLFLSNNPVKIVGNIHKLAE